MLMLSLSIAVAGFPAQAKPECPMAAKMHMQQMDMKDMKDCKGCDKTANKQDQQKKNGCCGDMACVAKCSSMSNITGPFLGHQSIPLSFASSSALRFYDSDDVVASHLLNTQDRPPKSLA